MGGGKYMKKTFLFEVLSPRSEEKNGKYHRAADTEVLFLFLSPQEGS